jgi:hypothetical protein
MDCPAQAVLGIRIGVFFFFCFFFVFFLADPDPDKNLYVDPDGDLDPNELSLLRQAKISMRIWMRNLIHEPGSLRRVKCQCKGFFPIFILK